MKSRITLALGALALTACNPINGQLKVTQTFSAHSHDNPYNCTPEDNRPVCGGPVLPDEFQVTPGTYSAGFDLSSRNAAVFSIKVGQGITRNIQLKIPNNNRVPTYSGPISLTHGESGQPFDLRGNINTRESDSAQERGWESCTYTEYHQVCGPRGCHTETISRPGQQWVEYHYHYTDTSLGVQLFRVGSSSAAATFAGERHSTDRVVDQAGVCR
jgi:hypothetical protein